MKKLSLNALREDNLVPASSLAFLKGGLTEVFTCGSNSCVDNTGSCDKNTCITNAGDCVVNDCHGNGAKNPGFGSCDPHGN